MTPMLPDLIARHQELREALFYNDTSSQADSREEYNRACLIEDAIEEVEAKIVAAGGELEDE